MYYPDTKTHKKKWKIILPLFILIMILSICYYYFIYNKEEVITNKYGICGLSDNETRTLFIENPLTYQVEDYFFYGQTLNLFNENYEMNKTDDLYGKTINLKNLCTNDDFVFIIDSKVDVKIPLENLEVGFYQLAINDGSDLKTLVYNGDINETFYTVTKDNTNLKIVISNDQKRFDNEENENFLANKYLFLEVSEEKLPSEYFDVVIDPEYLELTANGINYGSTINSVNQADVNLELAKKIKTYLETKGLKVALTRDTSAKSVYGEDSRLEFSYAHHAKFYLVISTVVANSEKYHGYEVYYSAHSSSQLASSISKEIKSTNMLEPSNAYDTSGVKSTGLADGYDAMKMIRESGGKALAAGTFSSESELNSYFNKDNPYGAQAIRIDFGYLSNSEDFDVLVNNSGLVTEAAAKGFLDYLEID